MNSIPFMEVNGSTELDTTTTQTTCPYCGVGCGVSVTQTQTTKGAQIQVQGDLKHPSNYGKLCIKGSHLADTLALDTRLLQPYMGRAHLKQPTEWTTALNKIAAQFQHCIDQYGAKSIAFYVSGQLLTEDYYVVNKFVKGYLGTANIDTNSRLCMSSAVAAHKRAFGEDLVPASYEDFEHTDMVVLVGSNTAWCHPVLYQRMMQAKERRKEEKLNGDGADAITSVHSPDDSVQSMDQYSAQQTAEANVQAIADLSDDIFVVVIDPRFTSTCETADLHLPILPGQDVSLFNGLLQYLQQYGYTNTAFVEQYTQGLEVALDSSQAEASIADVAKRTGISEDKILAFYQKFAETSKVMTLFSMGVNQSSRGVDKANSIINCHLLTGKIGYLGAAPFSMTGQPNAMGGREVGGLANMLASHMELDNPQHREYVQQFWNSPHIAQHAGLKAVDLFQAVETGEIKAIWIMATNPVVSMPDADQVKRALEKCEFVVVSDICIDTDTTEYADVLLPALAWGEKEGTVTNSERRISRQRAFLSAPSTVKADWWAVAQVAQKLGFSGFDFQSAHEIFLEHAQLSAYQNVALSERDQTDAFRYFNLQGLSDLSAEEYSDLSPIQWPVWEKPQELIGKSSAKNNPSAIQSSPKIDQATARLFAKGQFSHNNTKARFIATQAIDPVHAPSVDYPLILNTGRIRDQWHTMSRTGLSANLSHHRAEPYCEIHPQDALKFGIQVHDLVEVKSTWGRCILRAQFSEHIRRGQVFAPIHWNDQVASDARIGKVVNPVVDSISGEPEFKHTPVTIQPFHTQWQGILYVREGYEQDINLTLEHSMWWCKITMSKVLRYELAHREKLSTTMQHLKTRLPFSDESYEWLSFEDPSAQISHTVVLKDNLLIACLYIAPQDFLPDRDWVASLFKRERLSAMHRKALLAGQAMSITNAEGPLVCSCFKVGKNRIIQCIQENKIQHEKQVTACLKAGGNCGSCLPEIRGLIKACQMESVE